MQTFENQLWAVLHCGLGRAHRGSPAAGLRLEATYGAPVLLSGVAPLLLTTSELSALHSHYRTTIRQILRLPKNSPECFIMLLAGTLPLTALLHLRMLTLLGMIARLGPAGILNRVGRHALLTATNRHSWFVAVRKVSQKYGLQDPLLVLQQPPTRGRWKATCRSAVTAWWLGHFRGQAAILSSLKYCKYHFFSLSTPHPTITTARSPYEVARATTVATMLSGRYATDHRARRWDHANPTGRCRLCPPAPDHPAPEGSLEHQLLYCPALQEARTRVLQRWASYRVTHPHLAPLLAHHMGTEEAFMGFLLDPSSCPLVLALARDHGQVLDECHHMSRMWCHSIHVFRQRKLRRLGILK